MNQEISNNVDIVQNFPPNNEDKMNYNSNNIVQNIYYNINEINLNVKHNNTFKIDNNNNINSNYNNDEINNHIYDKPQENKNDIINTGPQSINLKINDISKRENQNNSGNKSIESSKIGFDDLNDIDKQIRMGFVRKVFGILSIQLLITLGGVCSTFNKSVRIFVKGHFYIFWICLIVILAIVIFMYIKRNHNFKIRVPFDYILLLIWTVCETYMLAVACSYYDKDIVITCIGMTSGVCLGLCLYACFSKNKFTYLGGTITCVIFCLVFYVVFGFIFTKWGLLIYCVIGVVLYGLFLIFDIKLIIGGLEIEFSIDDYIISALELYIDITKIFLYLLAFIGLVKK